MRGLKNNGRLLCSPGTSFAPLGPDGANTQNDRQTDGHANSMTESAQWGPFSEKGTLHILVLKENSFSNLLSAKMFTHIIGP